MLIERIVIIFILFVVFTKAEEISNETFPQDVASGSGTVVDQVIKPCCVIGGRSFHSVASAVHTLINNSIIKIIEPGVVLNTNISLEKLENISVIGQGTPIVNCNSIGAISFFSCNNVTIKGINWENCGSIDGSSYPGISFYKSSNLTIQSCSFSSSAGQALLLSEASGNIHINNSVFTHNNQYRGHGAAVEYIPADTAHTQARLVIDKCSFSNNGVAKSIVYIGSSEVRFNSYIQNSVFISNEAVPIYLSNHKLHISGNVLFKQNMAIAGGGIFSSSSTVIFKNNSNITFCNNSANTNGGAMYVNDSRIYFGETSVIKYVNNLAKSFGGALFSVNKSVVFFNGNTTVTFQSNKADTKGGALYCQYCDVLFDGNSAITFNDNIAMEGGAVSSRWYSILLFNGNTTVKYIGNDATEGRGGALLSYWYSNISFYGNSKVIFSGNIARFGGVVYSEFYSNILFNGNATVTMSDNLAADYGGAVCSRRFSQISFDGNATVTYENNQATDYGGAIYSDENCSITFNGSTMVAFNNNTVLLGGAIYSRWYSIVLFDGNSTVTFKGNEVTQSGSAILSQDYNNIAFQGNSAVTFVYNSATNGAAVYSISYSTISFDGNTTVTYEGNVASNQGGAVYLYTNSHVTFHGNSEVIFDNNKAGFGGGAISSESYCKVSFDGNTAVTFKGNKASGRGGGLYSRIYSSVVFDGNSQVAFSDNGAKLGGAVYSFSYSELSFDGNTVVTYEANEAFENGAAINSKENCSITLDGHSEVIFRNNRAMHGAAVYSRIYSHLAFNGYTKVTYQSNMAREYGGAIISDNHCNITFDANSKVTFSANRAKFGGTVYSSSYSQMSFDGNTTVTYKGNKASKIGGSVHSHKNSSISFDGNSTVKFIDNEAQNGGAIGSAKYSNISFIGNTNVFYIENDANTNGGAVYSVQNCSITFDGNSKVTFSDNEAKFGGAVSSKDYSVISFDGNTTVTYKGNNATENGGAIYCFETGSIISDGYSKVTFTSNKAATVGGAMSCNRSSLVLFQGNTKVEFTNNKAKDGGAINIQQSTMNLVMASLVRFNDNSASSNGGAIYLGDNDTLTFESEIMFHHNSASLFGGAIYGELKQTKQTKILSTSVDFCDNAAFVGDNVYMHIQPSCDEACLRSSIVGLNVTHNYPPIHLALYNPATCISTMETVSGCDTYFVNNIMLGQIIKINACVLSFYDQPAGGVNFVVSSESQYHKLDGTRFVQIGCNLFEGTSVIGKKISNKTNFSMTITSYSDSELEISVELIAELSPCHPGFYYDNTTLTQKCVCYDNSDIVSCSGSTSTIKRGYWFGIVDGKRTVAVCPSNYCNFTCCETTNGFYQLSPVRFNQCSSHRSGTACGSCEEGYTLSFDSAKCVSVDKCTPGQTALVIILSIIYWIVLVVLVFVVTYYHVEIGYFYVITYYYSMLDILLDQNLYVSQGLFTVVSIMSSAAKVTPQFLGQLCLVKNMSGIDQQFIHYVHPLAVTIILGMICLSARMSHRFSAFVSRGIIRVICFLLLLSYTSVATTSLLLLRSLTFQNVEKIYAYLSPSIEYFHGRHLPYAIIAILCTLVIVIGLPLLLLLEPFLNHKINFTRFKPLFDQFQGCYKDKYRSFAAYYMICRLTIISIITINSSNNNTTQALLLITTLLLALTQLIIQPYKHRTLNIFDGMILQIMIFASVISLFDNFSTAVLSVIIILLVILPLVAFVVMELTVYKENFKKIFLYFKSKFVTTINIDEVPPISVTGPAIDDNMRKNTAMIVDM